MVILSFLMEGDGEIMWGWILGLLAGLSADPQAAQLDRPRASAAVAAAYAAQATEQLPAPPAPAPPAPPTPKPPCPCGGIGRVLRPAAGGSYKIERCPCGACPSGNCPSDFGAAPASDPSAP